ncbi:uncharacterized protein LOC113669014 [Pocillopora damicornis]|uniref:uncharacterized protein LOC113669014 n=1 Tax=Pocillopora damicornis TaxID=46731 RepID=UPI000F55049F|nr:uncharacterized protein LOC113669014 [Pocillopora damicornis]
MLSSCSREVPPNQMMNLLTKKQSGHKTLKERLKSKNKTIQRLRNRVAWLELQLTLHYTEDKTTKDDREEIVVEDDCLKCEQLRKMLNKSLKLPPLPGLQNLDENQFDSRTETNSVISDKETVVSIDEDDFKLTIQPSHNSLSSDQKGNVENLPHDDDGFFRGDLAGNTCCILVVVMAMLLVSWI